MRPTFEEYALKLAEAASIRSEDPKWKVGAVALREDNSVAGVGFNGTVSGLNIDWSNDDIKRPRVIHAEQNALRYCKPGEIKFIAVNVMPCKNCIVTIASYGIKKVVYSLDYKDKAEVELLAKDFGIELIKI